MKILGIIPARYASTRFPAKALANIDGKPMIQRVYEQACKASSIAEVVVATDHEKVAAVVKTFGKVVMTASTHQSGTDRCAEVVSGIEDTFDFIINIQGDEPFIQPEQIDLLASILRPQTELATLVKKITDWETLFNPNVPKVVFNKNKEALYFSRSTIPFVREAKKEQWLEKHPFYKHIGIYAYRTAILKTISKLSPSLLEKAESLEQLRWIENGFTISIAETELDTVGIDTPEDLEKLKHAGWKIGGESKIS